MARRKQFNVSNELAILAAACSDPAARAKVLGACTEDCFHGRNLHIFRSLTACTSAEVVDVAIVVQRAGSKECGGRGYVEQVFGTEPPANLDVHLESLIKDQARAVALDAAKIWVEDIDDKTIDYDDVVREGTEILSRMAEPTIRKMSGKELATNYLADLDKRRAGDVPFKPTGYAPLNEALTYGMAPKFLTVVFGRPRNGKTTLMVDWVLRLLRLEHKPRILVLSQEEDRFSLLDMFVCNMSKMMNTELARDPDKIRNAQWQDIRSKVMRMIASDDRVVVMGDAFENVERTNEAVLNEKERIVATGGYDIVMHDMWQRILSDTRPGMIFEGLVREKRMAMKYGYRDVIYHQGKQEMEERKNKRPLLTDLKDSGGYGEVADDVLGAHRERAYNPAARRDLFELEVLKQKKGPGGDVMEAEHVAGQYRLEDERMADARENVKRQEEHKPKFMQDDDPI